MTAIALTRFWMSFSLLKFQILNANTRVRIIVDNLSDENNELNSFLETAESLQLDGPSDWSENLDKYLYGEEKEHES